jgi:hypothetical protein
MGSIGDDAIGGFNQFLSEQQKVAGKANMTVVQFDHEYEMLYNGVDIQTVKPYTRATYQPRGMTALNDAVGKTVSDVYARIKSFPESERTNKVLVMILTDGYENASREYTTDAVKKLVEERKTDGWEFVFVCAGLDKFAAASIGTGYGINAAQTAVFDHTPDGMRAMYCTLSNCSNQYRTSGNVDLTR